jgi:hypothetical protein
MTETDRYDYKIIYLQVDDSFYQKSRIYLNTLRRTSSRFETKILLGRNFTSFFVLFCFVFSFLLNVGRRAKELGVTANKRDGKGHRCN